MSSNETYRLIGIDPGTNILGYAVIEVHYPTLRLVHMGVVNMLQLDDPGDKLQKIFRDLTEVLRFYHPKEMALEAPFFGKNAQSMLKLGRAQGVAMAAALQLDMPVTEYAPREIKKSVTGNGNASKEQVAGMLRQIVPFATPDYLDATDALAVAVTHYNKTANPTLGGGRKKYSGWAKFMADNPDRVG